MSRVRRPSGTARAESPLYDAGFRRLWGGHLVSLLGDQIFPIALVALTLSHGGPVARTISVVFAARFTALGLFILIGGVIADRVDQLRGMIALDVLRGVAVGVMVLLGSGAPLAALAALTFLLGAAEAVFTPLYESVLPQLVPETALQQANSLSSLIKNLATVAGPAVAGLVVAGVGARTALLLDVLSFVVSAAALLGVRRGRRIPAASSGEESIWRSALAGVRVVLKLRWLAALEGVSIVHVLLAVGPWYVLLPTIAVERYGSVEAYGFFLTAFGIGGVCGALAGGRIRSRSRGLVALAGIGTFGFCCLVLAWHVPATVIAAVFAVGGFGTQMCDVVKTTAIQQSVERRFLGRVLSLDFFATFVAMPLGQVLGGVLVSRFSSESIMRGAGVVVLVTALLPLLVPQGITFGDASGPAPPPGTDSGGADVTGQPAVTP